MSASQFVSDSFKLIKKNFKTVAKATALITILLMVFSVSIQSTVQGDGSTSINSGGSFITSILTVMLTLSFINAHEKSRSLTNMKSSDVWSTMKSGQDVIDLILLNLLVFVYTFLWTLLFIIPGLVKSLSYSQANYIYFDAKHKGMKMSYNEAITASRQMMNGKKSVLFTIYVIFFAYLLVAILLGGLISIVFSPISVVLFAGVFFVVEFFILAFFINWQALTNANFYLYYKNK